jgi:hypothetical protein
MTILLLLLLLLSEPPRLKGPLLLRVLLRRRVGKSQANAKIKRPKQGRLNRIYHFHA